MLVCGQVKRLALTFVLRKLYLVASSRLPLSYPNRETPGFSIVMPTCVHLAQSSGQSLNLLFSMGFHWLFRATSVQPWKGQNLLCPFFQYWGGLLNVRLISGLFPYLLRLVMKSSAPLSLGEELSIVVLGKKGNALTDKWWCYHCENFEIRFWLAYPSCRQFPSSSVTFKMHWSSLYSVWIMKHDDLRYSVKTRMAHTTAINFRYVVLCACPALFNNRASTSGLYLCLDYSCNKTHLTCFSHSSA